MLGFDLSRPPGAEDGDTVAVLLHGRGSHRGDLQGLRGRLPDAWTLVTPQAPHPGHPWGYGPGWAWYRRSGGDEGARVEAPGLLRSLSALDAFLTELPHLVGFEPGALVLGGFSQGATVSMAYALTRPERVGVVLAFSGFLVEGPPLDGVELSPEAPPIFWAHGLRDQAVAHELAVEGRARLAEAGVRLQASDHDVGHWITPEAVRAGVRFADLFGASAG